MPRTTPARLVIGITGGPGAEFGVGLVEALARTSVETHLVMSASAERAIRDEAGVDPRALGRLADHTYDIDNQAARISSGSFLTMGMVVAPCSGESVASIAMGLASDLIQRAADVTIKEGRKLVLLLVEPASDPRLTEHRAPLSAVPNVVLRSVEGFSAGANPSLVEATTSALLFEFGIASGDPPGSTSVGQHHR